MAGLRNLHSSLDDLRESTQGTFKKTVLSLQKSIKKGKDGTVADFVLLTRYTEYKDKPKKKLPFCVVGDFTKSGWKTTIKDYVKGSTKRDDAIRGYVEYKAIPKIEQVEAKKGKTFELTFTISKRGGKKDTSAEKAQKLLESILPSTYFATVQEASAKVKSKALDDLKEMAPTQKPETMLEKLGALQQEINEAEGVAQLLLIDKMEEILDGLLSNISERPMTEKNLAAALRLKEAINTNEIKRLDILENSEDLELEDIEVEIEEDDIDAESIIEAIDLAYDYIPQEDTLDSSSLGNEIPSFQLFTMAAGFYDYDQSLSLVPNGPYTDILNKIKELESVKYMETVGESEQYIQDPSLKALVTNQRKTIMQGILTDIESWKSDVLSKIPKNVSEDLIVAVQVREDHLNGLKDILKQKIKLTENISSQSESVDSKLFEKYAEFIVSKRGLNKFLPNRISQQNNDEAMHETLEAPKMLLSLNMMQRAIFVRLYLQQKVKKPAALRILMTLLAFSGEGERQEFLIAYNTLSINGLPSDNKDINIKGIGLESLTKGTSLITFLQNDLDGLGLSSNSLFSLLLNELIKKPIRSISESAFLAIIVGDVGPADLPFKPGAWVKFGTATKLDEIIEVMESDKELAIRLSEGIINPEDPFMEFVSKHIGGSDLYIDYILAMHDFLKGPSLLVNSIKFLTQVRKLSSSKILDRLLFWLSHATDAHKGIYYFVRDGYFADSTHKSSPKHEQKIKNWNDKYKNNNSAAALRVHIENITGNGTKWVKTISKKENALLAALTLDEPDFEAYLAKLDVPQQDIKATAQNLSKAFELIKKIRQILTAYESNPVVRVGRKIFGMDEGLAGQIQSTIKEVGLQSDCVGSVLHCLGESMNKDEGLELFQTCLKRVLSSSYVDSIMRLITWKELDGMQQITEKLHKEFWFAASEQDPYEFLERGTDLLLQLQNTEEPTKSTEIEAITKDRTLIKKLGEKVIEAMTMSKLFQVFSTRGIGTFTSLFKQVLGIPLQFRHVGHDGEGNMGIQPVEQTWQTVVTNLGLANKDQNPFHSDYMASSYSKPKKSWNVNENKVFDLLLAWAKRLFLYYRHYQNGKMTQIDLQILYAKCHNALKGDGDLFHDLFHLLRLYAKSEGRGSKVVKFYNDLESSGFSTAPTFNNFVTQTKPTVRSSQKNLDEITELINKLPINLFVDCLDFKTQEVRSYLRLKTDFGVAKRSYIELQKQLPKLGSDIDFRNDFGDLWLSSLKLNLESENRNFINDTNLLVTKYEGFVRTTNQELGKLNVRKNTIVEDVANYLRSIVSLGSKLVGQDLELDINFKAPVVKVEAQRVLKAVKQIENKQLKQLKSKYDEEMGNLKELDPLYQKVKKAFAKFGANLTSTLVYYAQDTATRQALIKRLQLINNEHNSDGSNQIVNGLKADFRALEQALTNNSNALAAFAKNLYENPDRWSSLEPFSRMTGLLTQRLTAWVNVSAQVTQKQAEATAASDSLETLREKLPNLIDQYQESLTKQKTVLTTKLGKDEKQKAEYMRIYMKLQEEKALLESQKLSLNSKRLAAIGSIDVNEDTVSKLSSAVKYTLVPELIAEIRNKLAATISKMASNGNLSPEETLFANAIRQKIPFDNEEWAEYASFMTTVGDLTSIAGSQRGTQYNEGKFLHWQTGTTLGNEAAFKFAQSIATQREVRQVASQALMVLAGNEEAEGMMKNVLDKFHTNSEEFKQTLTKFTKKKEELDQKRKTYVSIALGILFAALSVFSGGASAIGSVQIVVALISAAIQSMVNSYMDYRAKGTGRYDLLKTTTANLLADEAAAVLGVLAGNMCVCIDVAIGGPSLSKSVNSAATAQDFAQKVFQVAGARTSKAAVNKLSQKVVDVTKNWIETGEVPSPSVQGFKDMVLSISKDYLFNLVLLSAEQGVVTIANATADSDTGWFFNNVLKRQHDGQYFDGNEYDSDGILKQKAVTFSTSKPFEAWGRQWGALFSGDISFKGFLDGMIQYEPSNNIVKGNMDNAGTSFNANLEAWCNNIVQYMTGTGKAGQGGREAAWAYFGKYALWGEVDGIKGIKQKVRQFTDGIFDCCKYSTTALEAAKNASIKQHKKFKNERGGEVLFDRDQTLNDARGLLDQLRESLLQNYKDHLAATFKQSGKAQALLMKIPKEDAQLKLKITGLVHQQRYDEIQELYEQLRWEAFPQTAFEELPDVKYSAFGSSGFVTALLNLDATFKAKRTLVEAKQYFLNEIVPYLSSDTNFAKRVLNETVWYRMHVFRIQDFIKAGIKDTKGIQDISQILDFTGSELIKMAKVKSPYQEVNINSSNTTIKALFELYEKYIQYRAAIKSNSDIGVLFLDGKAKQNTRRLCAAGCSHFYKLMLKRRPPTDSNLWLNALSFFFEAYAPGEFKRLDDIEFWTGTTDSDDSGNDSDSDDDHTKTYLDLEAQLATLLDSYPQFSEEQDVYDELQELRWTSQSEELEPLAQKAIQSIMEGLKSKPLPKVTLDLEENTFVSNLKQGKLDFQSLELGTAKTVTEKIRNSRLGDNHRSYIQSHQGEWLDVPGDGDCFYHAVAATGVVGHSIATIKQTYLRKLMAIWTYASNTDIEDNEPNAWRAALNSIEDTSALAQQGISRDNANAVLLIGRAFLNSLIEVVVSGNWHRNGGDTQEVFALIMGINIVVVPRTGVNHNLNPGGNTTIIVGNIGGHYIVHNNN